MKKNWIKIIFFLLTAGILISIGTNVLADDDDDDDERHEYYEEYDDDDEEHDRYQDDYESDYDSTSPERNQFNGQQSEEFWNIWSRLPRNNPDNVLPITEPSELNFTSGNQKVRIYSIPQNGQILVSAHDIANLVDAEVTYYSKSKIAIVKKDNMELIIRAGSNAIFENRMKQPMPVEAAGYEDSVYLPISVAANALNYRVSWDSINKSIILKTIERK